MPKDEGLVSRASQGDRIACHVIYKNYVEAMFHTVVRIVGNSEDAQDVTQETFIKVFQKLNSFRGEATLGAWIKRIAVNTALNFIRDKKKIFFEELNEKITISDKIEIDEVQWQNDILQVHHAIKKLPDGCRVVFNLYLLEGYQHKEVADMLGISESTSKTQYRRAKRILKEILS